MVHTIVRAVLAGQSTGYRALSLLGLALYLPSPSVSRLSWCCVYVIFLLRYVLLYLLVS